MRVLRVVTLCAGALLLTAYGCGSNAAPTDPPDDNPPEVPAFQATRAFGDLTQQVDFGPRAPGSAGHSACRQWLVARLRESTSQVEEQAFTFRTATGETLALTNIVARFAGTGESSRTLLLGAHWDTRPVADQDPDPERRDEPILGANDGASGVAVLLEMARLFAADPPPRPVVIVLFDAEDMGNTPLTAGEPLSGFSIGARQFAAGLGADQPAEAIVVDMVGDANLRLMKEGYSRQSHPTFLNHVWSTAQALGFTQFSDAVTGQIIDDHLPLIQIGIPSIDIIDLDYPGPGSNRYWHTHEDTVAHCAPESLRAVGQTLAQVIYGG